MSAPTPVTAWYLLNPVTKRLGFNHIEDGHAASDKPADKFGRKWSKGTWEKKLALLVPQGPGLPPKLQLS
jgi:hypothetical protein